MTPQNDSSYTSLLFTPRTGDGSKALPDYRTPRNGDRATATRSPSPTPEYGRPSREGSVSFAAAGGGPFGGGSRSFREGSLFRESSAGLDAAPFGRRGTPAERSRLGPTAGGEKAKGLQSPSLGASRGRRRSVTPSPPPRDTHPPPPPSQSMFDSPAVGGTGWPSVSAPESAAPADENTYASVRQATQRGALAERTVPAGEDTWVIVFGFTAADMERLMQEFHQCGDIVQFGSFGASTRGNWIYIQYQNKYAAQRALQRNGEQLSPSLMVGVKPLDPVHRAAIHDYQERGQVGLVAGSVETPKPLQPRSYLINANSTALVMPTQRNGLWDKVTEYIFGL